ncbi:MAG: glycoside hydrolase family 130 protein [Ignavibacteriales bacterium]|nr:glycoside hydrolase family 130 protein [Ignavibacteriales bacterium]
MSLEILPIKILPDSKRVITLFFILHPERIKQIIKRIISLSDEETSQHIEKIKIQFGNRHRNIHEVILSNYEKVRGHIVNDLKITHEKKMLIGAYFTKEYSIQSAALFNPSIVAHPDQTGLHHDELRFVMSLRATGEGHLSSIEFREGLIKNNEVIVADVSKICELPRRLENKKFEKRLIGERFRSKKNLLEIFLRDLDEEFSFDEFENASRGKRNTKEENELYDELLDFLESNYEIEFDSNSTLDERVIFPTAKSESVGMEDVRLVKFQNADGTSCYYGTYTAYNGKTFRVQLLKTVDFRRFNIHTLHGSQIEDKGMALFPRKINSKYVITSRNDGENLYIMFSDDLYNWNEKKILYEPSKAFDFVQVGNCGSPIETKYGWLLITHAVGYFRRYSISAMLLDIDDPTKIIGSLDEPLIEPIESEREGYVPNVVYSCGSMLHGDNVIIPFAMFDSYCGFARIPLEELISKMS